MRRVRGRKVLSAGNPSRDGGSSPIIRIFAVWTPEPRIIRTPPDGPTRSSSGNTRPQTKRTYCASSGSTPPPVAPRPKRPIWTNTSNTGGSSTTSCSQTARSQGAAESTSPTAEPPQRSAGTSSIPPGRAGRWGPGCSNTGSKSSNPSAAYAASRPDVATGPPVLRKTGVRPAGGAQGLLGRRIRPLCHGVHGTEVTAPAVIAAAAASRGSSARVRRKTSGRARPARRNPRRAPRPRAAIVRRSGSRS